MQRYHYIYYGYSDADINKLWENCTFVFDNNVLLDLYRVTSETRNLLFLALRKFEARVWLPQQVVHEFYINRTAVIFESNSRYSDKIDQIKNRGIVVSDPRNDRILDTLLSIFSNKVGLKYSSDELTKLYIEAELRYHDGIPPGFECKKKSFPEKYSDFIKWKQIIEFSKKEKENVVFITNDVKEDWWYIVQGKVQGPLYNLREEFTSETQYNFHMYTMLNFLEKFAESTGKKMSDLIKNDLENLNSNSIVNV